MSGSEGGGPQAFGVLVASLGVGAVAGALLLPKLRDRVSRDALVAIATVLYALAMLGASAGNRDTRVYMVLFRRRPPTPSSRGSGRDAFYDE